jgi:hypothetical protein
MPLQFPFDGDFFQNTCVSLTAGIPQVINIGPLVNSGPAAAAASVQLWYIPAGKAVNAANAVPILLAPSEYVLDANTLVQQQIGPGDSAEWTCSPLTPLEGHFFLFAQGNAPPTAVTFSGATPTNALNIFAV